MRWSKAQATPYLTAAIAAIFALILAVTTLGTNDIFLYQTSADIASNQGGHFLYRNDRIQVLRDGQPYYKEIFNHPAALILVLKSIRETSRILNVPFPALFKVLTSLALLAGTLVAIRLTADRPLSSRILVTLAPLPILVAGYHGNTDQFQFVFLLLSLYLLTAPARPFAAGLAFGACLSFKYSSMILLPAILCSFRTAGDAIRFAGAVAIVTIPPAIPYLMAEPIDYLRHTIGYQPMQPDWGIAFFQRRLHLPYKTYLVARYGLLLGFVVLARWMRTWNQPPSLYVQCGLVYHLLLVFAPGFGIQYLSWLAPWTAAIANRWTVLAYCFQGGFAIALYGFWSGESGWYFADSFRPVPLPVHARIFEFLAWVSVVISTLGLLSRPEIYDRLPRAFQTRWLRAMAIEQPPPTPPSAVPSEVD